MLGTSMSVSQQPALGPEVEDDATSERGRTVSGATTVTEMAGPDGRSRPNDQGQKALQHAPNAAPDDPSATLSTQWAVIDASN